MFSPNFPHLDQYFGQGKIKTLNQLRGNSSYSNITEMNMITAPVKSRQQNEYEDPTVVNKTELLPRFYGCAHPEIRNDFNRRFLATFLPNFSNFRLFFFFFLHILHHFQGYFESLSCDIYSKRWLFVESGRMRKSSSFFRNSAISSWQKALWPSPGEPGYPSFSAKTLCTFLIFCRAFPQHSWLPSGPMTNLCPPAYRTPPSANLPLCLYDRLASALMTKKRRREETRGAPRRRSGSGSCGRWSGQPGDARPVKMGSSLPRSACFPTFFSIFLKPNNINNLAILTPEV